MILLRLLSWQYIRKHGPRSLLTLTGIVFGVAVFVAMHAANQSVFDAFQETINRIAGATELQVTAGEPGFDGLLRPGPGLDEPPPHELEVKPAAHGDLARSVLLDSQHG